MPPDLGVLPMFGDIAPGAEIDGVRCFKTRGVTHHVVAQLIAIVFRLECDDGAFVDDVAGQRGRIDFAPHSHPATAVADGVGGEHALAVAGLNHSSAVQRQESKLART